MSFRVAVVFAAIASVFGFAPSSKMSNSRVLSMSNMDTLPGITGPLGFFDPLGLSKNLDDIEVSRFRECELKVIIFDFSHSKVNCFILVLYLLYCSMVVLLC